MHEFTPLRRHMRQHLRTSIRRDKTAPPQKKRQQTPTPQENDARDALCKRPLRNTYKLRPQPPRNANQLGRIRHLASSVALLLANTQCIGQPRVALLDLAFARTGEHEFGPRARHCRAEVPTGARQRDRSQTGLVFGAGGWGMARLCAGVLCGEAEREQTTQGDVSVNAERGARTCDAP